MAQEQSTGLTGLASALATLLATLPPRIEGQWFYNQQFSLDGYRFVRCRFDNCVLTTTRGTFILEGCFIDNNTRIEFRSEAAKIVRLYTHVAPQARQEALKYWPELAPEYAPDGRFSVR